MGPGVRCRNGSFNGLSASSCLGARRPVRRRARRLSTACDSTEKIDEDLLDLIGGYGSSSRLARRSPEAGCHGSVC